MQGEAVVIYGEPHLRMVLAQQAHIANLGLRRATEVLADFDVSEIYFERKKYV